MGSIFAHAQFLLQPSLLRMRNFYCNLVFCACAKFSGLDLVPGVYQRCGSAEQLVALMRRIQQARTLLL